MKHYFFPSGFVHIGNYLSRLQIPHTGSNRNFDDDILSFFAELHLSPAVFSVLGPEMTRKLKVKKSAHILIG